jgi:hypothetical protein
MSTPFIADFARVGKQPHIQISKALQKVALKTPKVFFGQKFFNGYAQSLNDIFCS